MRYVWAAAALSVLVGVTGCAAQEAEAPQNVKSFVGSTVQQLEQKLPPDTAYVVYDLSTPVTGKEPRYGTAEGGTDQVWLIVAACGNTDKLAVGVLNVNDYTENTAATAREGGYDELLYECREH